MRVVGMLRQELGLELSRDDSSKEEDKEEPCLRSPWVLRAAGALVEWRWCASKSHSDSDAASPPAPPLTHVCAAYDIHLCIKWMP